MRQSETLSKRIDDRGVACHRLRLKIKDRRGPMVGLRFDESNTRFFDDEKRTIR